MCLNLLDLSNLLEIGDWRLEIGEEEEEEEEFWILEIGDWRLERACLLAIRDSVPLRVLTLGVSH